MERYRRKKLIIIIALILTISGLSIGFAAFTSILTISSSATVTPDESTFSVLFSSSGTSQLTNTVTPNASGGATGESATISGTTISGLKANFTEPGQTITYTFWAHNAGAYIAYLRNITYGIVSGGSSFKLCIPGTDTTESLVTAACADINVSIVVGDINITESTTIINKSLNTDEYAQLKLMITYAPAGDRADGEFSVSFGNITLNYSSVGYGNEISFYIDGNTYTALEGMTWGEFVDSEYNSDGIFKYSTTQGTNGLITFNCPLSSSQIYSAQRDAYGVNADETAWKIDFVYINDLIIDGKTYGIGWDD